MLKLVVGIVTTRFYKDNDLNTRFIDFTIYGSRCPRWPIDSNTNIPVIQVSVGDKIPEKMRGSQQNVGTLLSHIAFKTAFAL
jgi:hypothetical protein